MTADAAARHNRRKVVKASYVVEDWDIIGSLGEKCKPYDVLGRTGERRKEGAADMNRALG